MVHEENSVKLCKFETFIKWYKILVKWPIVRSSVLTIKQRKK